MELLFSLTKFKNILIKLYFINIIFINNYLFLINNFVLI